MADKKIIKFQRKKNKKLIKKIYRIVRIPVAVLAVVFALFLSAQMLGDVAVSNVSDVLRQLPYLFSHGSGFPYTVEDADNVNLELIGDSPAVISNGTLTVLSSTARKMCEIPLGFSNEKIIARGGRALIYSNNSSVAVISGKTEKVGEFTAESAIVAAALSKNGRTAFSFTSDEAQSVLAVYSQRNKEIFRWNCSKEYISALALSPNGRSVAVSAVGAENAQIYSRFIIFNIKKTVPEADVRLEASMILKLISGSHGRVIAVCDNRTVVFNKNGEILLELNYGDDSLISAVSDGKGNTLVCYKEGGGSKINAARISASGKLTCTVTVGEQPECTCIRAGRFVLVNGKTVTEYSSSGKERRKFETQEEPSEAVIASNCVYTVENSQLCKY